MGADAAIEACIDAGRYAATAGKKTMADRGASGKRGSLQHGGLRHGGFRHGGLQHGGLAVRRKGHGSNPGKGPNRTGANPIALNSRPMPVRSWLVRRLKASSISAMRSAGTALLSALARVSMPNRRRNSPCSIGPWIAAAMLAAAS